MNKRQLRISGYKDYIAIDKVNEQGETVDTILYLKKGEQKDCFLKWEAEINHRKQSWFEPAIIRFDGEKIEMTHKSIYGENWFEVEEKELLAPHLTKFS